MRAFVTIIGLLLAMGGPGLAQGNGQVTHVYAGGWQANDFHDPANPGCSIGGDGSVPGSRLMMGASLHKPNPMNLVIRRAAWAIPAGTTIYVRAVFSNGQSLPLTGVGQGQSITVDLDDSIVPVWVHLLTASASMQLFFRGNEAPYPWTFDLNGTSRVINAMDDCLKEHNIQGVSLPFMRDVPTQAQPPLYSSNPYASDPPPLPNTPAPPVGDSALHPPSSAQSYTAQPRAQYEPVETNRAPPIPSPHARSDDPSDQNWVLNVLAGASMLIILVVILSIAVYFLPTLLANRRKMDHGTLLFVLNIFVGWTVLGWFFCLLWAALGQTRAQRQFYERGARLVLTIGVGFAAWSLSAA